MQAQIDQVIVQILKTPFLFLFLSHRSQGGLLNEKMQKMYLRSAVMINPVDLASNEDTDLAVLPPLLVGQ